MDNINQRKELVFQNESELPDTEEEYTECSTYGDYSPSCPWKAPGMCVEDFL